MKTNNSKVVRLNPNEQAVIELFRKEGENAVLNELKGLMSNSNMFSQESPIIKQLIHLLDNPTFYSLKKLVDSNFITNEDFYKLIDAMEKYKNILIVGPTGSGKSTLLRALLEYQLNTFPKHRVVLLQRYNELSVENEESSRNIRQVFNLSMDEINFLQESEDQSLLCIAETTSTNDALALAMGLNAESRILTSINGVNWKVRLKGFVNGRARNMYESTLSNRSFVIVKTDFSPKLCVSEIWEEQLQF
ncbi:Cdc6-like AAA superfamily ATPase [Paenibacillus sp. 1182]|uniref:nSTAND3 domain-containing NTPase n=1 Tax=Paenibacillus sp. 1182 TaxID=2806565 RepID=UPI001AE14F92|nr:ATPase, T2SS/T4P/T4SS family [Paenibacillus sp. 1182]MBP1308754.1 Cdc6-like AAA superfamily ATPase [Paenibacillus sp. 1182]